MRRALAPLPPAPAARLLILAGFAVLGQLHWMRMLDAPSLGRTLAPVAVALGAAVLLLLCERLPPRAGAYATLFLAPGALVAAAFAAGIEWRMLRPGGWEILGPGIAQGLETVSGVRLPYEGVDQWPRLVLQLGGALLVTLSAMLAVWPRDDRLPPTRGDDEPERGYPFLALTGLLALVAVPAVALGNEQPFVVGSILAALVVLFLFLERILTRPGAGVAALLVVAVLGALPVASAADREGPWFDYQSFAEAVGPDDPVRIDFGHGDYGAIQLPRDGREVLRVRAKEPLYWKAEVLDRFDGVRWTAGGGSANVPEEDVSPRWRDEPRWIETIGVTLRRLRTRTLVAAGTTVRLERSTRSASPGQTPGVWQTERDLRRGDSWEAEVYAPRPSGPELQAASADPNFRRGAELVVSFPIDPLTATGELRPAARLLPRSPDDRVPTYADVTFPAWESPFQFPEARYPQLGLEGMAGDPALTVSPYRRTYRLAQRLKSLSETPYAYVRAINAYMQDGFTYTERPGPPPEGRMPLDAFLFDTKSGYCQHFSAAMALLLRMGGVPARVVTGFSPGGFSKRRGEWIVRDTDAHSWVEVWFERFGWVTFDPTPPATPARSQIAAIEEEQPEDATTGDDPAEAGDDAAAGGTDDAEGGRSGVRGDLLLDPSGRDVDGAGADEPEAVGGVSRTLLLAGGGVLLVLAAGVAWWAIRRRLRPPPVDPVERALWELERALERTGRDVPPGTTLSELERRLGGSDAAAGYLRTLRTARYARGPIRTTTEQRRALRRELASGLGMTGRLRAFWALPPRRG